MALGIVAAGGADDVHKGLVDLIDQGIGFRLALCSAPAVPQALPAQFFVLGLEYQIVVIIGKGIADLCPDPLVLLHTVFLVRGEVRQPAAVIVQIEDDIQTAVSRPVHHFLHRRKIAVTDGVVIPHQIGPRHRNTKSVESGVSVALDHLLGNHRTAPGGLIGFRRAVAPLGDPVAAGFIGIAQVDADAHILYQLGSRNVPHRGLFLGQRRSRNGTAAPEHTGSHCAGKYFFQIHGPFPCGKAPLCHSIFMPARTHVPACGSP